MSSIWNQIKQLFSEVEQSSPNEPVDHELISRSESELVFQEQFSSSIINRQIKKWVADQYGSHLNGTQSRNDHLQFIDKESLKGFVIYFNSTEFKVNEIIAFFDSLKKIVLSQGYYAYVSDRRSYVKSGKKEVTERHYLKPSQRQEKNNLISQQFGNITIELIFKNNSIQYLKFSAVSYKDHLYKDASPFTELINIITGTI